MLVVFQLAVDEMAINRWWFIQSLTGSRCVPESEDKTPSISSACILCQLNWTSSRHVCAFFWRRSDQWWQESQIDSTFWCHLRSIKGIWIKWILMVAARIACPSIESNCSTSRTNRATLTYLLHVIGTRSVKRESYWIRPFEEELLGMPHFFATRSSNGITRYIQVLPGNANRRHVRNEKICFFDLRSFLVVFVSHPNLSVSNSRE